MATKGHIEFLPGSRDDNRSLLPGHSRRRQRRPDFVGHYVAAVPSQSFTHTATANAVIGDVWRELDRPGTWENIGVVDRVIDPEFDDERLVGFSFETTAAGKKYVGVAKPASRFDRREMGWRIETSEVNGLLEVTLEPNGAATQITVGLDVESVGVLSTMFFPVVAAAIGSGLPGAVDQFAAALGS